MSVMLVAPATIIEAARVPLDMVRVGVPRQVALDLYALEAHAGPTLAATVANWVEASLDDGATWNALGDDPVTGFQVGAMTAGQRKAVLFRLTIPALTQIRTRAIALLVGEGATPYGVPEEWLPPTEQFDGGVFTDPNAGVPGPIDKGTF